MFTRRWWHDVDDLTMSQYSTYLDQLLQNVTVPRELLVCLSSSSCCSDDSHHQIMDDYYRQVTESVESAVNVYIPCKKSVDCTYNVPGWNDYVHDKHSDARTAYLEWLYNGKPRYGNVFYRMQRTRATFKLALRYCRQQELQFRADACAANLSNKDPIKFCQSFKKIVTVGLQSMRPLLVMSMEMTILQKCEGTTFSSCTIQCHVIMMLKWLRICY